MTFYKLHSIVLLTYQHLVSRFLITPATILFCPFYFLSASLWPVSNIYNICFRLFCFRVFCFVFVIRFVWKEMEADNKHLQKSNNNILSK